MSSASPSPPQVILVTGCSSGIGQATADLLARCGHLVYASARRAESVDALAQWAAACHGNAHALTLDVTDETSITTAVRQVLDKQGRLDCLINNAGYGQAGAVEDVTPDLWRRQLETNLIGAIALTQAVLPTMRAQRRGRIINVSSAAAHVSLPLLGAYCAAKHALDAFSNALRAEIASFGIDVVLVEPGPITARFRDNMEHNLARHPIHTNSPYENLYRALQAYWHMQVGRKSKTSADVARLIRKAVQARKPRTRYRITAIAKVVPWIQPFIPDRVFDRAVLHSMRALLRKADSRRQRVECQRLEHCEEIHRRCGG